MCPRAAPHTPDMLFLHIDEQRVGGYDRYHIRLESGLCYGLRRTADQTGPMVYEQGGSWPIPAGRLFTSTVGTEGHC